MNKFIVAILALLFQACMNNHTGNATCEDKSLSEVSKKTEWEDSIKINIKSENRDYENLTISIYNPTDDTIRLCQSYRIGNQNDSVVVSGINLEIPKMLFPREEATFKINLGLDSVEYRKECTYNLSIKGKSKKENVLFYRVLRLGNRYKLKGETILEPDTVIFPVLYIEDYQ